MNKLTVQVDCTVIPRLRVVRVKGVLLIQLFALCCVIMLIIFVKISIIFFVHYSHSDHKISFYKIFVFELNTMVIRDHQTDVIRTV